MSQTPKLSVGYDFNRTVLILRGVPYDEVAFVSTLVPAWELDARHSIKPADTDEPTGRVLTFAVIEKLRWLREWAVFQRSKPDGFPSIATHGWNYSSSAVNSQF
jgi:hypothetical protein